MRWVRIGVAVLVGLVLAVLFVLGADAITSDRPASMTTISDPGYRDVEWFDVRRSEDAGKLGARHSVMGNRAISQKANTCGMSPDQFRFRFDAPVRITGVDVSVDLPALHLSLIEVMLSAHAERGYGGENRASDPLLHVNWTGGLSVEKTTTIPGGVDLAAGEHVTMGAWVCSIGEDDQFQPEAILFYEWL